MDREVLKERLDALGVIFGQQLGSESVREVLTTARECVNVVDGLQFAMEEIQDHYDKQYNAMNKSYWEGVAFAVESIRRNTVNEKNITS